MAPGALVLGGAVLRCLSALVTQPPVAGLAGGCLSFGGLFALVSVGVFACLVIQLYCPCLPCIDRGLLTYRDAICMIVIFSRVPPGLTRFTSSFTDPSVTFLASWSDMLHFQRYSMALHFYNRMPAL